MKNKSVVKFLGLSFFSFVAWTTYAAGLQVCDLQRCHMTRDGLLLCPESACTPVPPVKNQP
jgi:hypothetical protein